MADFPTLTRGLDADSGFSESYAVDPVIRSNFDNGSLQTRKKFTRTLRTFEGKYRWISNTDKLAFQTFFETTVGYGALEFNWTNPSSGLVHVVKFMSLPEVQTEDTNKNEWSIGIKLVEAYPQNPS